MTVEGVDPGKHQALIDNHEELVIEHNGLADAHVSALAYIKELEQKLHDALHPPSPNPAEALSQGSPGNDSTTPQTDTPAQPVNS